MTNVDRLQAELTATRAEISQVRAKEDELRVKEQELKLAIAAEQVISAYAEDGPVGIFGYWIQRRKKKDWREARRAVRHWLSSMSPVLTFPDGQLDDGTLKLQLHVTAADRSEVIDQSAHVLNEIGASVRAQRNDGVDFPSLTVLVINSDDPPTFDPIKQPTVTLLLTDEGWNLATPGAFPAIIASGGADCALLVDQARRITLSRGHFGK
ncbi:hypothetical protein [Streptomyces sp. NPDC059970]|uniref:hypothetical protein n=1 Tax=Streptomyces sp. NPDC059970 TaxID=3347019 RepID=UPI00367618BB